MSDQVLTPKHVPEKAAAEWLEGAEQWQNPFDAALRHTDLKERRRGVISRTWICAALALGVALGVVGGLLGTIGLSVVGALAVLAALLAVVGALSAMRLSLQAHMAYQEAHVTQKAACGTIRIVKSPDDPTPVSIEELAEHES